MVVNCETYKHLYINIVIHLLMLDILFYSKTLYKHIKTRLDFSPFFAFVFILERFYFYLHVLCVSMYVCANVCKYPQRPEDGIRCPGVEITRGCESLDMGIGKFPTEKFLSAEPSFQLKDFNS